MASNKTPNLGLDTWAEMDYFKRAELNGNFNKLDDKIGILQELGNSPRSLAAALSDQGVNVKDFGAKGDGIADDTSAFQEAINYCETSKSPLFIPVGEYKLLGSLLIPDTLTIKGTNTFNSVVGSTNSQCKLLTYSQYALKPKTVNGKVHAYFEDIAFYNQHVTGTLFDFGIELSKIRGCFFYSYDYVISKGIGGLSYIEKNNFLNCKISAIKGNIVDAFIIDNYINADPTKTATNLIDCGELSTSKIDGNFIDFAFTGIKAAYGSGANIVNNTIDYCYRGIDLRGLTNYRINNNGFLHTSKSFVTANGRVSTPEMVSNDWIAIYLYNSIDGVTVSNNNAKDTDLLLSLEVNAYRNIKTNGNVNVTNPTKVVKMNREVADWFTNDGANLEIAEMNYKNYTVLPTPTLTGGNVQTFNGHKIYYNGKLLRNDNGTWKDMLGTTVTP